jgi:6-pyruvoyl-tetrahydropterin synthase
VISDEEVVTRANDGQYFVFLESTAEAKTYATAETFSTMKQLVKWVIDELDYYLGNDTVKESDEIVRTGGVAIVELPVGSLTIHKSSNRDAKLDLPLKKEKE